MRQGSGFRAIGNRIRNSSFIVGIYIAVLVLFGLALWRTWMDFWTSLEGAKLLQLVDMGDPLLELGNVVTLAAMPQVITIVGFYVVLAIPADDKSLTWLRVFAIGIFLFFIGLDVYTGYLYYVQGWRFPLALSFVADTAFSELGLTLAFGLALELFPDVRKQLNIGSHKVVDGFQSLSTVNGPGKSHTPRPISPPPDILALMGQDPIREKSNRKNY